MKKAQIWSIDLIAGVIIFAAALVIFYFYALNADREAEQTLFALTTDGEQIAAMLLTAGYPLNWTPASVRVIGLVSDNKINETKLAAFDVLASTDYEKTRRLFNTRYHWYLNFSEPMIINGTRKNHLGQQSQEPRQLIKVDRLTVYRNKPAIVHLYLWE